MYTGRLLASTLVAISIGDFYGSLKLVDAHFCKQIRQRQEIRTLTQGQRDDFFHAVRQLQSGPRPTRYDKFVERHYQARISAHGWPWFLTWHRAFIRDFEIGLQEVNNDVMLPYWDWSYDSQAPELSPVFKSNWFGGNGRPSDGCIMDGHFASWQPLYPRPHCLRRKWDQGSTISSFHPPETLQMAAYNSTDFEQFRKQLEAPTHGQVHNNIGGDMPSMYSPNDPLFWVHHAFIDKLWYDWQHLRPENMRSYGGRNSDQTPANVNDYLLPYNLKVADVLDTRTLCYTYAPFHAASLHHRQQQQQQRRRRRRRDIVSNLQGTAYSATGAKSSGLLDVDAVDITETVTKALPAVVGNLLDVPSSADRSEIVALRDCKPLPEDWLRMNHLNVTEVRRTEAAIHGAVKQLNSMLDYVSPVSLIARMDVLEVLAGQHRKFTATKGGKQWMITVATDASGNADVPNTVSKVRESLGLQQLLQGRNTVHALTGLVGIGGATQFAENYGVKL